MGKELKTLIWIASAKRDLKGMPVDVQDTFGYALHLVQAGKKHEQAKPLKGFGSAGVLEVVEDDAGAPTAPCTPSGSRTRCMSFTASKRRARAALPRLSPTWTWSAND